MDSVLECGICYRTYNAGRRCPRELRCKHRFCQSCLLALSRFSAQGEESRRAASVIVCPLCRQTTYISGDGPGSELRVAESVLQLVVAAGVPEEEEGEDERPEEGQHAGDDVRSGDEGEASLASAGTRGGRLRRSWRKVWQIIRWRKARRVGEEYMTNDDMRNLALLSSYMF